MSALTEDANLTSNQLLSGPPVEFDILGGCCYVWCLWSSVSFGAMSPCICCPYQFMKTQEIGLDESRLRYQSDSYLVKHDKLIPLDRIQDVTIYENCFHRCFCISEIRVQTAGGGNVPEVIIIAPKNANDLRDRIMRNRDEFVHREMGKTSQNQAGASATMDIASEEEVGLLVHTLNRIESKIMVASERL